MDLPRHGLWSNSSWTIVSRRIRRRQSHKNRPLILNFHHLWLSLWLRHTPNSRNRRLRRLLNRHLHALPFLVQRPIRHHPVRQTPRMFRLRHMLAEGRRGDSLVAEPAVQAHMIRDVETEFGRRHVDVGGEVVSDGSALVAIDSEIFAVVAGDDGVTHGDCVR